MKKKNKNQDQNIHAAKKMYQHSNTSILYIEKVISTYIDDYQILTILSNENGSIV